MHRILLLFALFTLAVAVVLRKLNADRVLHGLKDVRLSSSAGDAARKMLDSVKQNEVEVRAPKRHWAAAADLGSKWLVLASESADGLSARAHGQAALQVGLYLLSLRDPKALARRRWAIRFGHVFPIFSLIVVIFALIAARLAGLWGLGIIMASCGIAVCAQILVLSTERRASALVAVVLEKKHIYPRLSDEESVVASARAHAWRSILPGIFARFVT